MIIQNSKCVVGVWILKSYLQPLNYILSFTASVSWG